MAIRRLAPGASWDGAPSPDLIQWSANQAILVPDAWEDEPKTGEARKRGFISMDEPAEVRVLGHGTSQFQNVNC